jgi:hypothetical protein
MSPYCGFCFRLVKTLIASGAILFKIVIITVVSLRVKRSNLYKTYLNIISNNEKISCIYNDK